MQKPTIAAITTPLAPSGVGIIRISGPMAHKIASRLFRPAEKILNAPAYTAVYGRIFHDNIELDNCIAVSFRAPNSFTGEDTIELNCHGSVFLLKKILSLLIQNGARQAQAGEFTRQAFENGKLDLTQAESILSTIHAQNSQMLNAANTVKNGALFKKITEIKSRIVYIAAELTAHIDFPDDEIPIDFTSLKSSLANCINQLQNLIDSFNRTLIWRQGVTAVLAGAPNSGKSTLLNTLAGFERAIVTDIAGTTRDIIEEQIMLDDLQVRFIDTAGIRNSSDKIEQIGIEKSRENIEKADIILAIFDSSKNLTTHDNEIIELCKNRPAIALLNKSDLPCAPLAPFACEGCGNPQIGGGRYFSATLQISAAQNIGLQDLSKHIIKALGANYQTNDETALINNRQRDLTAKALEILQQTELDFAQNQSADIIAFNIEEVVAILSELSGESASQQIVDEVFANFCVGK